MSACSELDHGCAWVTAADEVTRCLPIVGTDVAAKSGYFAESTCHVAVTTQLKSIATAPAYVVEVDAANGLKYRMFHGDDE